MPVKGPLSLGDIILLLNFSKKPICNPAPLKCIIPKKAIKPPIPPLKILTDKFGASPAKANDLPKPAPNRPIKLPKIILNVTIPKEAKRPYNKNLPNLCSSFNSFFVAKKVKKVGNKENEHGLKNIETPAIMATKTKPKLLKFGTTLVIKYIKV